MTIDYSNPILARASVENCMPPVELMPAAEMVNGTNMKLSSAAATWYLPLTGMTHYLPYLPYSATPSVSSTSQQRFIPKDSKADVRASASADLALQEKKSSSVTTKKAKKRLSAGSSGSRIYTDKVRNWDILCGRGGRSNNHYGNKRYRHVINEMKIKYKTTEGKLQKTDLSATIVDYVYSYGGRFIKKDQQEGKYYLLTLKEARKKTSQALREQKDNLFTLKMP